MTYVYTSMGDGTMAIEIDFADEGVELQGRTCIKGAEAEVDRYLPVFEADLRRNFSDLFPLPVMPEGGMSE